MGEAAVKYSFLIPYYKRLGHLHNTFKSFMHHYLERSDFEIVLAEDAKNVQSKRDHDQLLETVEYFRESLPITHLILSMPTWNPVVGFNEAAKWASGQFYIITNPECFHLENILEGFDEEFGNNPDCYVICSCRNRKGCKLFIESFDELNGTDAEWYQHSQFRNANFHFCSALSRNNWVKVNGFDEEYVHGIAYDDADFRNSVKKAGILFRVRDDLLTIHIDHCSFPSPPNASELIQKNRETFQRKWEGK